MAGSTNIDRVLAQDEKLINDFVQTRLKKVLEELKQLTEEGSDDLIAWSSCFSYLARTYGHSSDEAFKWFKYYLREGKIPATVQLPVLMQIYTDSEVDGGFVNIMKKVMAAEPERDRERRINDMNKELKSQIDSEGKLTIYRGCFESAFGVNSDASRPIEKAFAFTLDKEVARRFAICWYPKRAMLYTLKVPLDEVARYNIYEEDKTVIIIPQSKGGTACVTELEEIPASQYRPDEEKEMAKRAYRTNIGPI